MHRAAQQQANTHKFFTSSNSVPVTVNVKIFSRSSSGLTFISCNGSSSEKCQGGSSSAAKEGGWDIQWRFVKVTFGSRGRWRCVHLHMHTIHTIHTMHTRHTMHAIHTMHTPTLYTHVHYTHYTRYSHYTHYAHYSHYTHYIHYKLHYTHSGRFFLHSYNANS